MSEETNGNVRIRRKIAYCTLFFLFVNVVLFILEAVNCGSTKISVETVLRFGGQYFDSICLDGQFYRLFTSTFLHISLKHIICNMICLLLIGPDIEDYFGHINFTIIYLLSGITGNITELVIELVRDQLNVIVAGASGSISGLFGAVVILSMDPVTRKRYPWYRTALLLVPLLFPSKANLQVAYAAHIGGAVGGFLIALLIIFIKSRKRT